MPATYGQTTPLDSSQYYMGDTLEMWVAPTALTLTTPTPPTGTLVKTGGGTIAAAATTYTVTSPTTTKLYDKQRIKLASGEVIVIDASGQTASLVDGTRSFAAGVSTFSIYPPLTTVTIAASESYVSMVPFYSIEMANFEGKANIVSFKNAGTNPYPVKKKSTQESSFTTDGYATRLDPALPFLRTLANQIGQFAFIRYIPPDNQALEFTAEVASDTRNAKVGEGYKAPFEFAPGVPTFVDLTPT